MHTLYPPLVDDETAPMSDETDHPTDVLPAELKENFDTMRALVKASSSSGGTNGRKRKGNTSHEDLDNDNDDDDDEEFEAKKLRVAIKTAVAVENEVARLRSGIAELEALLAQQEGGEVVAFPSLPPVVPSDELFDEKESEEDTAERDLSKKTNGSGGGCGEVIHG